MKSIVLIITLCIFQSAQADDYHPSREGNYWAWGHWDAVDTDFSTNELARQFGPAQFDTNGNWGELTNRAQASIRFPKSNYTNGEPVVVTILIRNYSTNEVLKIPCELPHTPMEFVVADEKGQLLEPKASTDPMPRGLVHSSAMDARADPMEQARFKQGIDSTFDLSKPGTYTIYGRDRVGQADYAQKKSVWFILTTGKSYHSHWRTVAEIIELHEPTKA